MPKKLTVKRKWEDETSATIEIYDGKKLVGKINYEVSFPRVWGKPPPGVGEILDTIIYEKEYRSRGILADLVEGILCDMKCKGAATVKVATPEKKIWSRFGFQETGPRHGMVGMERKLEDMECVCRVLELVKKDSKVLREV